MAPLNFNPANNITSNNLDQCWTRNSSSNHLYVALVFDERRTCVRAVYMLDYTIRLCIPARTRDMSDTGDWTGLLWLHCAQCVLCSVLIVRRCWRTINEHLRVYLHKEQACRNAGLIVNVIRSFTFLVLIFKLITFKIKANSGHTCNDIEDTLYFMQIKKLFHINRLTLINDRLYFVHIFKNHVSIQGGLRYVLNTASKGGLRYVQPHAKAVLCAQYWQGTLSIGMFYWQETLSTCQRRQSKVSSIATEGRLWYVLLPGNVI